MQDLQDDKNYPLTSTVVIANDALHLCYQMSVLEKKSLLVTLANIDALDKSECILGDDGSMLFPVVEISAKEFFNALGLSSNRRDYFETLDPVFARLSTTSFCLRDYGRKGKSSKFYTFFSTIQITDEVKNSKTSEIEHTGNYRVVYRHSPDLYQFVKELRRNFTQFCLQPALKFNSAYAIRFYEYFLEAWSKAKADDYSSVILKVSLEDIINEFDFKNNTLSPSVRKKLKPAYYKADGTFDYKNFKKRCLLPALKEINSFSGFSVEYSTERVNRKIAYLDFLLTKKQESKNHDEKIGSEIIESCSDDRLSDIDSSVETAGNNELLQKLLDLGISGSVTKKLVKEYDESLLLFGLSYCEHNCSPGIENKAAYFLSGCRNGWFMEIWQKQQEIDRKFIEAEEERRKKVELEKLYAEGKARRDPDGNIVLKTQEELTAELAADETAEKIFSSLNEEDKLELLEFVRSEMSEFQLRLYKDKNLDELWSNLSFRGSVKKNLFEWYQKKLAALSL